MENEQVSSDNDSIEDFPEKWDQWRADTRSLDTMRQVALDAMRLTDDDAAFYDYAAKHHYTVNEVAYYLNAYEYGGDEGLRAIHVPDIIELEAARRATKMIAKLLDEWYEGRLPYRITDEGTAIGVYEIQQRWDGEKFLFPVCQLRLTVASHHWHLYWMRKFDAWWPYPLPEQGRKFTLYARMVQVYENRWVCFWG